MIVHMIEKSSLFENLMRLSAARVLCVGDVMLDKFVYGAVERISRQTAATFTAERIDPLNLVAIEVEAEKSARVLPLAPGIADDLFEHDGQITKRAIRAVTLSALAPRTKSSCASRSRAHSRSIRPKRRFSG